MGSVLDEIEGENQMKTKVSEAQPVEGRRRGKSRKESGQYIAEITKRKLIKYTQESGTVLSTI